MIQRKGLWVAGWLIMGAMLMAGAAADAAETAGGLTLQASGPWTPHKLATPLTKKLAEGIEIAGNGTGTCCGGWQYVYDGVRPGQAYRIRTHVTYKEIASVRDSLDPMTVWDAWKADSADSGKMPWNHLMPKPAGAGTLDFENVIVAPEDATHLTVRYTLRWTKGSSQWSAPRIEAVETPKGEPVKICILTAPKNKASRVPIQPLSEGLGLAKDVAASVDLWGSLALEACKRKPQLIVTPEVVIGGADRISGAVEVPGPATRPFEKIAREHNVYLVLGMRQRDGDAYYNICALVGPEGKVEGIYRKVHLATSEGLSGLSAGDSFPVFDTKIGRIGCLICMDTMLCESARMLALNGADFICMPIMGDLRADRWTPGPPIFSEDRWKALMRTRAIDNQLTMVIARNSAQGSCVIDRKGEFLAWNEGDAEIIEATVPARDGYLSWNGGDVDETTYMLRRPHLYGAYVDEGEVKALAPQK